MLSEIRKVLCLIKVYYNLLWRYCANFKPLPIQEFIIFSRQMSIIRFVYVWHPYVFCWPSFFVFTNVKQDSYKVWSYDDRALLQSALLY